MAGNNDNRYRRWILNRNNKKLGKRHNIKDSKALNNELNYEKIQETIINRSQKIMGAKIIPEIVPPPLITGDFLVRENDLLIATENDKLIELDIS
jgi:hypothetical protein